MTEPLLRRAGDCRVSRISPGDTNKFVMMVDPVTDKLIEQQSMETDREKRKKLVWEIERKLAEDDARPIIYYNRGGICWQPQVKGLTVMVNSIYNGWRMEDIWLDR